MIIGVGSVYLMLWVKFLQIHLQPIVEKEVADSQCGFSAIVDALNDFLCTSTNRKGY